MDLNIPKKYFHDRLVLLLLSTNVFLALLTFVWVLLRLGASHGSGYIVQYRADVGINAFKTGTIADLLAFIIFAFLVLITHTVLSIRAYEIHRQLSIAILALAILLLTTGVIVSNALLVLR